MKITMDTQKIDDPDFFGELLREYAFKEDFGCYTCFDLVKEFKPIVDEVTNVRLKFALGIHESQDPPYYDNDDLRARAQYYTNGSIHVGWYWDGDGCLAFIEGDRVAVNYDCKKRYGWEWVK